MQCCRSRVLNAKCSLGFSSLFSRQSSSQLLVNSDYVKDKLSVSPTEIALIQASWDDCQGFSQRHIPGAICFNGLQCRDKSSQFNNMLPATADFENYVSSLGIGNKTHVIVYEDNLAEKFLGFAARVWFMFKVFGHDAVSVLDGGLFAWTKVGGQLTSGTSQAITKKNFTATFRSNLVASFEDIVTNFQQHDSARQVVDARPQPAFKGLKESYGAKGHIPNALNLPAADLLQSGREYKLLCRKMCIQGCSIDNDDGFMIQCDCCSEWFHSKCVNVADFQAIDIDQYHCPACSLINGPSVAKEWHNFHRYDYSDALADDKPRQAGTRSFIEWLKTQEFAKPSTSNLDVLANGCDLSVRYLEQSGFCRPIFLEKSAGLGLRVPELPFTVDDVGQLVGLDKTVDVIDVFNQHSFSMQLAQFIEFFNAKNRRRLYNLISLEVSNTELSKLVEMPEVVSEISWVKRYWPEDVVTTEDDPNSPNLFKPEVAKFCLISMEDSYTDFHGEKRFYLAPPTDHNLAVYESWVSDAKQSERFLPRELPPKEVFEVRLQPGQTLLIPSGWIHAVLTTADSLVFGGNFLHHLSIESQIRIFLMEKRLKTVEKYMFPSFEFVNFFAAEGIFEQLKELNEENRQCVPVLLDGATALSLFLKSWMDDLKLRCKKPLVGPLRDLNMTYAQVVKLLDREIKKNKKISTDFLVASSTAVGHESMSIGANDKLRFVSNFEVASAESKKLPGLKMSVKLPVVKKPKKTSKPVLLRVKLKKPTRLDVNSGCSAQNSPSCSFSVTDNVLKKKRSKKKRPSSPGSPAADVSHKKAFATNANYVAQKADIMGNKTSLKLKLSALSAVESMQKSDDGMGADALQHPLVKLKIPAGSVKTKKSSKSKKGKPEQLPSSDSSNTRCRSPQDARQSFASDILLSGNSNISIRECKVTSGPENSHLSPVSSKSPPAQAAFSPVRQFGSFSPSQQTFAYKSADTVIAKSEPSTPNSAILSPLQENASPPLGFSLLSFSQSSEKDEQDDVGPEPAELETSCLATGFGANDSGNCSLNVQSNDDDDEDDSELHIAVDDTQEAAQYSIFDLAEAPVSLSMHGRPQKKKPWAMKAEPFRNTFDSSYKQIDPILGKCTGDSEFLYPSLNDSDDEFAVSPKAKKSKAEQLWTPGSADSDSTKAKTVKILTSVDTVVSFMPSNVCGATSSDDSRIDEAISSVRSESKLTSQQQPQQQSASTGVTSVVEQRSMVNKEATLKKSSASIVKQSAGKKGQATVKQRLASKLKLHKHVHF